MYTLDKIKLNIVKLINKTLGQKLIQASDLVYPPNPDFGDLSLPCFNVAKTLNKTAVEAAEWLVSQVKCDEIIVTTKAIGPYLNFIFNRNYLVKSAISEIEETGLEYGKNKKGRAKRVMVEYSNPNTHKEFHAGHLRNLFYGDSVHKILSANGYKSIPVSYINDFGIHTAKTLWAYKEFYQDKNLPQNKGYFLGQVYVRAAQEIEKKPLAKEMVSLMMKKIESRKGDEYKLWQETRKWSIKQFDKIYQEVNIKFDHIFYESEFIEKGKELVAELYKKNFLVKSQGAIIADLGKDGLGVLLFLRSDGTAMYPVADIPLAIEKFKKYKLDKSIYVVDIRQGLYFKQLFKTMELIGHKKSMLHLGYEVVKLPEGMMSSRSGNVISYEDLREKLTKKATSETKKRHKNWSAKKTEETVKKIVNGVLKFEMIKVGAHQAIILDVNKILRLEGFTAGYLQYAYARIKSIIKKSKTVSKNKSGEIKKLKILFDKLKEVKEAQLIMKLAKYPAVVELAGDNYNPAEVAKYLFELAQLFNDYYHSVPVLRTEKNTKQARLALITAVSQVIANGLELLGIEALEEM